MPGSQKNSPNSDWNPQSNLLKVFGVSLELSNDPRKYFGFTFDEFREHFFYHIITQRPSLMLKESSLLRKVFHNWKYLSSKRGKTATTVQSGVTAALTESRMQTTFCPNTLTNITNVAGVNEKEVGILWQKTRGRRVFSVFMWRNHFPKLKITFPSEVLVSSGKRPYRNLTFHNVLARQGSSFCNRARLNF